jgi:hypothetical protein
MTTLVQSAVGVTHAGTAGFGVILLWSLVGITVSLAAAHFGLDFSTLN